MRRHIVWTLRIIILALLWLPVVFPSLERERAGERLKPVVVLARQDVLHDPLTAVAIERKIKANFGGSRSIEFKTFGAANRHPLEDFEELGDLVKSSRGIVVMLASPELWGPGARKFNEALRDTRAFREKDLYWMEPQELKVNSGTPHPQSYLVVNDVFLPHLSFLGEESHASIEVLGKLAPNETVVGEIVLRAGESLLASRNVDFTADGSGKVKSIVEVPVSFVKAGTQVLSVTLNIPQAPSPLNVASTTVNVVHSKTTVLHIAMGPDWSLRSFRQKLKFWPNLDLLSYYILRDITSDVTISPNQMSLIEFPSDKLFGEQLASFHGVVIQNFPFDSFLGMRESENLVQYVKNGGRVVLQAGPMSFTTHNSSILSLFPCRQAPQFDTDKTYTWEVGEGSFAGASSFFSALPQIQSSVTAIGCQPKKGALVLARTRDGHHPTILSMPLDKGLVVSILSGDWHTRFAQVPVRDEADKMRRVLGANAVESLFQWVVEFLQRRQDSGLRPPDIAGPRMYAEDRLLPVRSRGVSRLDAVVELMSDSHLVSKGNLAYLDFLGMEVVLLESPLGEGSLPPGNDALQKSLHLDFHGTAFPARRPGIWPIFKGSAAAVEHLPNPLVFEGVASVEKIVSQAQEARPRRTREYMPLLEVYPWLLALTLGLLAFEQYLIHIVWRGKLDRDSSLGVGKAGPQA